MGNPPLSREDAKTGPQPPAADLQGSEAALPPAPSALPELGLPARDVVTTTPADNTAGRENTASENDTGLRQQLAAGARDIGSILSSADSSAATVNYASQLAVGLINQKVDDWLKIYGNARVSLGTDKKVTGDFLLPLMDRDDSLLFSQVGMRNNQARNTVNAGLGYRQYTGDWMLGINTFYDYDYTGGNRRLGAGVEAWRDYLKLSANGYYGLTGWHQSVLSAMKDYDERPANGFDMNAEAYLPSMPSLGMSLKYARYLGSGISVAESSPSPDTLKNNPAVLTAGINYTPFPLLTFSALRSFGDASDTRLEMGVNYRLGVPFYRQISPDSVDLNRSLAGSKYDFVDRNYNIVMQYRKQDLLRIELPAHMQAQAADTVTIPLRVSRDKYGIKSVDWSVSPELIAHGGHYKELSSEVLQVTLPAYVFGVGGKAPQSYPIQAVARDKEGNLSNTATMSLDVVPSQNVITGLTLSPDAEILPANNAKSYTVTARVADARNAALAEQPVTFSLAGLLNEKGEPGTELTAADGTQDPEQLTTATSRDGTAVVKLRSRVSGRGSITAVMNNGNSRHIPVQFNADAATAAVSAVVLQGTKTTKVADGKSAFSYTVTVLDVNKNPVPGVTVTPSADNATVAVHAGAATDAQGRTTFTLTGTKAVADVTASARVGSGVAVNADRRVAFMADAATAAMSTVLLQGTETTKPADGKSAFSYTVTVLDRNKNPVPGVTVTPSADNATVAVHAGAATDAQGQTIFTLTGTKAVADVTASAKAVGRGTSVNADRKVSFTADSSTAKVSAVVPASPGAPADGTVDVVTVTVKDANGNPVGNAAVSLSATNGATLHESVTTDAQGQATAPLSSKKAGVVTVTAKVAGGKDAGQTATVTFTAGAPAQTASGVKTDKASYAAGSDMTVTVTLKDANGNPVAGQASLLTAEAVTVAHASLSGSWKENGAGIYTANYTAITAGTGLRAVLKLPGWSKGSDSAAYAITAGAPAQAA
ncbi:inverse autotransporter beta domain-containing protein, partial [Erwinia persicina]|uniref:inverse autotransporter beta domain-containing protein n=1 Tax=Erwinia persicina TaxID=55211 RepID=UPI003C12C284